MEETIRSFAKQFEWDAKIENEKKIKRTGKYILCGMGGSHLQGDVMQNAYTGLDLSVYQDYGLPAWPDKVLKDTLIIVSSYSGNTEETISAFEEAIKKGYPVAVSTTGGKLLEMAKANEVPYVQIPDTGVQPRAALGYTFKALAAILGKEDIIHAATELGAALNPSEFEEEGKQLAKMIHGRIPIVYASNHNYAIAYNWKIKLNETGKIPAFYNVFPEVNHNEMTGFAGSEETKPLNDKFYFLFLRDEEDHSRIKRRMEVMAEQLQARKFPVKTIVTEGATKLQKIFTSLVIADWTAYHTALLYNNESEQVPMVEEFKKLLG